MKRKTSFSQFGIAMIMIACLAGCSEMQSAFNWLDKPLVDADSTPTVGEIIRVFTATAKNPDGAEQITQYTETPTGEEYQYSGKSFVTIISNAPANTPVPPTVEVVIPSTTQKPAINLGLDVIPITVDSFNRFHSLLVSHAMIKLNTVNNKRAGHFTTDLSLKKGPSYGLFAWCTSKEKNLREIVSKVSFSMLVDGAEIDTRKFSWIYHQDTKGNYCALPGALVTNIQKGTYHIIITETINSDFSSEIGNYDTGDYIYDLKVDFN